MIEKEKNRKIGRQKKKSSFYHVKEKEQKIWPAVAMALVGS